MRPMFSIVLPTWNRAYVLWKAIESIRSQTVSDWELVVVDDGSTDCSLRLLEEFQEPRMNVVSTGNRGPSAARNTGLNKARGIYVAYLDSDNSWHPTFLQEMLRSIDKNPDAVLHYCGQICTFWERTANGIWFKLKEEEQPRRQYSLSDAWSLHAPDVSCMVHKRELAESIGGWDENCRWLEDWDFFLRACLFAPEGMKWVPHVLMEYRQVFGEGADGICAQAREDRHAEIAGRRYLLEKWRHHPDFAAREKLEKKAEDLRMFRDQEYSA